MLISLYGHLLIHQYIYIYGIIISSCADIFVCWLAGWLTNDTIWMRDGHPEPPIVLMWKKFSVFHRKRPHHDSTLIKFYPCLLASILRFFYSFIGIPRKSWAVYWHDTHEVNDSGGVDKMQFRKVVRMLQDDGRDGGCSQRSDLPSGKHTKKLLKMVIYSQMGFLSQRNGGTLW